MAHASNDLPAPNRFPAPWTVARSAGGYAILDADQRAVAFVYFVNDTRATSNQPVTSQEGQQVVAAMGCLRDHGLIAAHGFDDRRGAGSATCAA
jgi:hypothetical protein